MVGRAILLVLFLIISQAIANVGKEEINQTTPFLRYTVTSHHHTMQILDHIGYTDEAFKRGMSTIPRITITHISSRWGKHANTYPVSIKKSIFLRLLASEALIANEEIEKERSKLLKIYHHLQRGPIARHEDRWLHQLAKKYRIIKNLHAPLTLKQIEALIQRVDIVPPSIILAQGAIESGWGTSRFAVEGNALFGQWSFSKTALKPKEQRHNLGNYGLATFKTPLDAVRAYLLNLNTHPAYLEFRQLRAQLRQENRALSGMTLVHTLKHYSERKEAYVKELIKLIQSNNLVWLDHAKLQDNHPIVIHPDA
jgi:uncharacterized FlgJ-related protein